MVGVSGNRRAAALLATSVLARLPLAMFSIALLVHIHRLTGSFAVAGLASAAYVIGRGLTSPLLGRLVDRCGQTRVLISCATASATLLAAVAALPASAPTPLPVAVSFAIGSVSPPISACVRTLLPTVVEPSVLTAAYTVETTALELTFIAGPPLALGLATGISTRAPLLVGATILLGATGVFAVQPASRHWRGRGVTTVQRSGSLRSPAIRTLILILVAAGIIFGAVDVAVAATASALHHIAATGPLLGIWGVGSLLGGILGTRLRHNIHPRAVTGQIIFLAAAHATLILGSGNLIVLGSLLLIAGATISPSTGAIYALVGRVAPARSQTEAFAWLLSASATGASIGTAAAGALSQTAGPQAAFALAASAGAVAVLTAIVRQHTLSAEPFDGHEPARAKISVSSRHPIVKKPGTAHGSR